MTVDSLLPAMTNAAKTAFGNVWDKVEHYAVPEFKKIGTQIVAIEVHKKEYTPDGARLLMQMQVTACRGVLVAMTELTLQQVEAAINAVLKAIADVVNKAIGFALL